MPDPAAKTQEQHPQVQQPPQDNAVTQNIVAPGVHIPTRNKSNQLESRLCPKKILGRPSDTQPCRLGCSEVKLGCPNGQKIIKN